MANTLIIIVAVQLLIVSASACGPNCLTCTGMACQTCSSNFCLYSGNCLASIDPKCTTCDSATNCLTCLTGYSPRYNDSLCIACSPSTDQNCDSIYSSCSVNNCAPCQSYAVLTTLFPPSSSCQICSLIYPNCQKCNNNVCITCTIGFALNVSASYKQCDLCNILNCNTCTDGPVCGICNTGYYLQINGTCSSCVYPCTTCSSATICTACTSLSNIYILYLNSCVRCFVVFVGCNTCTNSTCLSCKAGYFFNSGSCSACITHCSTCTNATVCINCAVSYFLSSGSCQTCGDIFCNTCTSFHNCISCISGYLPRLSDTQCVGCSNETDINCDSIFNSCNLNKCISCNSFAINGNNQCLPCNQVYRNCLTCNNSRCLTCQSSYVLNATANYLECVKCVIPKCNTCIDGPICSSCMYGYYPANGTCFPCRLPCASCLSLTSCLSCDISRGNLYIYNSSYNSCVFCNDSIQGTDGCYLCINKYNCLYCYPGYYLFNKTCIACMPICGSCNSTNCLSCINSSYIFNYTTSQCNYCSNYINNCTTCTSSSICLTCNVGYIIYTQPSICTPCSSVFQGCAQCDIKQCSSCLSGLALQSDFTCSPICQSPCVLCTTIATQCKSCILGYYLSGNVCLRCNSTCTACLSLTVCLTCIQDYAYYNGTCKPCFAGQNFNPFTLNCQNCSAHCTTCYWWTGCTSCQKLFQLVSINGLNFCNDICGDTYVFDAPCDLLKGVANDGCTDQCTIEPNYNCSKNPQIFSINGTMTPLNTSQCSYIGKLSISICSAQQSITSNTLMLTFSIVPYLYGLPTSRDSQATIQSIFQLISLTSLATYTIDINSQAQTITFNIDHTSDISQLGLTFMINLGPLSSNPMFRYMSSVSYPFQVNQILTAGRLGTLQPSDSLSLCGLLYSWSSGLAICAVVIMVMGIFGKELVALDQVVLCQSVFLLLLFKQGQLNLSLMALSGLKFSTGFHFADKNIPLNQSPSYIMGLDTSSFLSNFNFNLLAYMFPLLSSFFILIYKLRYKHLPAKRDLAQQTYEVIMGETILYLAIFNFIPLVAYSNIFYTQSSKQNYYDTIAIFASFIFVIFGVFNYFVKPEIVGIFRSCFRTESEYREARKTGWVEKYSQCISKRCFQQRFSQKYAKITNNFYLVYLIYLFLFSFLTTLASFPYVPFVLIIQGVMLGLVLLIRPYFNIYQKLRGVLTWLITFLGSFIVFLQPKSLIMPVIFLVLLSIHFVMSVVVIIVSLVNQIKRKCNNRSQVVRKLMKQGQVENEKAALRELILRYQKIEHKDKTIDHEVEKIQMKFNDDNQIIPQDASSLIKNDNKDIPDEEMIRFQDEIIEEEQDHFRFQKGMEFFNKYEGTIDKQLVQQEYHDIES